MTPEARRTWRNVAVLVLAQSVLGAQMTIQFIAGGLVGQQLAWTPCLATLPLSMMILGSTLSARPLAGFMARHGRRAGFTLASAVAGTGAVLATLGVRYANFGLFMAGTTLCGCYMAAQGFFRFAATDTAPPELEPKAISLVLAGGLVSALTGPAIVAATGSLMATPFLATYATVIGLNLAGPLIFSFLDIPRRPPPPPRPAGAPSATPLIRQPQIVVAIICGMVSYALMNLVMTSTPLAMVGCGFSPDIVAGVVSSHVLAMYVPSFFTGHLIARFGAPRIVAMGLVILAAAGAVALSGITLGNFFGTLVLLGLGWNFGYIGATAMLTRAQGREGRERIQGINDSFVFGGVFFASLGSGGLLNCTGGGTVAGWNAVNLAMVPFLLLAGAALVWLMQRRRQAA
ncbi:MFS transporter [Paracoccus suum]|uniref:MFS transporter n=1 Tax=Paracoccus suum TaxID=2259340 RepID=A0A344PJP6_9RHOB|nr:MFS transporter [Paracoccus suum]AXC49601.1 MFS transporter [Paracoccus suum]